jgi:hypothetical protein
MSESPTGPSVIDSGGAQTAQAEHVVLRGNDDLTAWDCFVDRSPQGSIFCRSWWLRAVAPGRFEIHILRNAAGIVCGLPAVRIRRRLHEALGLPLLTQVLGVLLPPPTSASYEKTLSRDAQLTETLIRRLPEVDEVLIRCHPNFTNWLPFYWNGYLQTTRYTYVIDGLSDPISALARFSHEQRKHVKKAERTVRVREDLDPERFYDAYLTILKSQGKAISYSRELFLRIVAATYQNNAGKTWYAVDPQANLHAAILVIWDAHSAYYLISAIDPLLGRSGAASLLVTRAIQHVAQFTPRFDFEGSMIRSVENSARKFGARQVPYFQITRDNRGVLLRAAEALQQAYGFVAKPLRKRLGR